MAVTHLVTTATGSRPVTLWHRSDLTSGQAALMLGRTAIGWLDVPASAAQPVALAEAGYFVLAFDTPNWGNTADMASIDAVLAWALSRGAYSDRVIVVGHNRGALAALNWSTRHPAQVAALCLQSPIPDLAGHWGRNTGDRASMNAAYGGSQATFDAAVPEWDPARIHRLYDRRDLLGKGPGRFVVFRHPADTQSPVTVTDLLCGAGGAQIGPGAQDPTLNPPSTVIATTVGLAERWEPYATAAARMAKWSAFICAAPVNQGYQGGDGSSSVQLPADTILDAFPAAARPVTLWLFADSFAGTVDCATGQYAAGLPLRNVIAVEDANGQIVGQVYGPGPGADYAPLQPSDWPTRWYWPIDATLDANGNPLVACWHVETGGRYGHLVDTHLVRLDPESLDIVSATALGSASGTLFVEQFLDPDPADPDLMVYVYLQEYLPTYDTYGPGESGVRQHVGRVPLASIYVPSAWRWWTGTAWSSTMSAATRLRDHTGAEIRDDATVTRTAEGSYLMAAKVMNEPNFRLLTAPAPEGPWRYEGDLLDAGDTGQPRYGAEVFSYHPKFHAHLSAAGEHALTYNSNLFDRPGDAETATSITTFRPRHMPVSLARIARPRARRRIAGT